MKKYTILLMLCLAFGYVKAQTILVNSNVISVHEDVTFPLWLDSMSTIEIGTQVVSISALEFNIVPATNGNSLVFSQIKTITSQETVPNGMTWKITAVLLDSTAINNSSSGGGGQVIVSGGGGGNMPVALSEESAITMHIPDAMIYCDSLQEGGYDNWVVPSLEEALFISSGGGIVAGARTNNELWTITPNGGSGDFYIYALALPGYVVSTEPGGNFSGLRCVRSESISVSGSGSSSGGSNTASTLGSGMPTMISTEATIGQMSWGAAALYCESLNESGYSDWIMPTLKQLTYASTGGCVIPDARTNNWIWTRSEYSQEQFYIFQLLTPSFGSGGKQLSTQYPLNSVSYYEHCRCVR